MVKENISGFWKWFWIVLAGMILSIIWYFVITFGISRYYTEKGNRYYYKQKYDKAIDAYETALKFDSENADVYNSLGYTYYMDYNDTQALDYYNKALAIEPKHINALYNKGTVFSVLKEYEKAHKSFNKVLEITPNAIGILYTIGTVYDAQNDFESSLKIYKQILEIDSTHPYVHNSLGNVYSSLNQNEIAEEFYLQHIKMFPNDYVGYTNLYELMLTQNKIFDSELKSTYMAQFNKDKNAFISYEMLKVLEDTSKGKKVDISSWQDKYKDISLSGWKFNKLDEWVDSFTEGAMKVELKNEIEIFKLHKVEQK